MSQIAVFFLQDLEQRFRSIEGSYKSIWKLKAERAELEEVKRMMTQQRMETHQLREIVADEVSDDDVVRSIFTTPTPEFLNRQTQLSLEARTAVDLPQVLSPSPARASTAAASSKPGTAGAGYVPGMRSYQETSSPLKPRPWIV